MGERIRMPHEGEEIRPVGAIVRDVSVNLKDVIRSEMRLARAEIKDAVGHLGKHSIRVGIFGVIAALGTLPFLAFLVIGLGRLLGDNYWLSSLLVSVIMVAIGGLVAYAAYRQIKERDLSLPETRESVRESLHIVDRKTRDISEAASRRVE